MKKRDTGHRMRTHRCLPAMVATLAAVLTNTATAFAYTTPSTGTIGYEAYNMAFNMQQGGWGYLVGFAGLAIAIWRGFEGAYKQALGTILCSGLFAMMPQILSTMGYTI